DAATDQMGKLNVLGAFDNMYFQQMPSQYPACALTARVRFERVEEGNHAIRIYIMDEDGASIGPKLDGNISVKIQDNVGTAMVNLILNMRGLEFKQFGKYRVDLAIDGNIQASLPLRVSQAPNRPSQHSIKPPEQTD
ncbi:MAG: hypothetical protein ISS71_00605, partial [Phycisphaerae bacterium]|nr:hypothetical protein [Phycisphaerae bacterium]